MGNVKWYWILVAATPLLLLLLLPIIIVVIALATPGKIDKGVAKNLFMASPKLANFKVDPKMYDFSMSPVMHDFTSGFKKLSWVPKIFADSDEDSDVEDDD